MKKATISIYLLICLILIVGCSKETPEIKEARKEIKTYEKQIKQLEEQLEEKDNEYEIVSEQLEEEVDSYQEFIKEAIKYLSDDEVSKLAKNEWSYTIQIDGKPITDNEDIKINKSDFEITIAEEQSMVSTVITAISEKGSIDGEYQNHLEIIGIEPIDTKSTDGTIVTGFRYEFKDVPKNTNFKLKLSSELRERLGLSSAVINVNVK